MGEEDDFVTLMLKKSQQREKTQVFRPLAPTQPDSPESYSMAISSVDMEEVEDFVKKMKDKIK